MSCVPQHFPCYSPSDSSPLLVLHSLQLLLKAWGLLPPVWLQGCQRRLSERQSSDPSAPPLDFQTLFKLPGFKHKVPANVVPTVSTTMSLSPAYLHTSSTLQAVFSLLPLHLQFLLPGTPPSLPSPARFYSASSKANPGWPPILAGGPAFRKPSKNPAISIASPIAPWLPECPSAAPLGTAASYLSSSSVPVLSMPGSQH